MLFGKKKLPPIRSLIGEGMKVQGELRFAEGLRVDGEICGDLLAEDGRSLLIISENARIQGRVKAAHVIINGTVEGPVHATELLELQPRARIVGDVQYQTLEMHQGATIHGELRPRQVAEALTVDEKPALKLASSKEA
jgi:cytoskeletal protein CcmA (bactofilin family)